MMRRTIQRAILGLFVAAAVVVGLPRAMANPLPSGPGQARDFRDLTALKVAFDRKHMVAAYDTAGTRDPRWNTEAKLYLDAMATRLGGVGTGISMEQLMTMGSELIERGCMDPLVAYCHGRNLAMRGELRAAEPLLRRAALHLPQSKYPACRAYFANLRYTSVLAGLQEWESVAEQRLLQVDLLVRAVSQDTYDLDDQRVLYLHVKNAVSDLRLGDLQALIVALEKQTSPANVFLYYQLLGDAYRRLGGVALQSEAAWDQLLPEDRAEVEAMMQQAREQYRMAMVAHPRAPEPAVGLLACAVLTGPEPGRGYRQLFDAAVAAEFDNRAAYSYMFAALARHGGAPAVWALAKECAATKRYDTAVPELFVSELLNVPKIAGGPGYDFWRREADVYALANQALDALAESKTLPQERHWYLSLHAAVAWRFGQYNEARKYLDDAGNQLMLAAFTAVNAPPLEAITQCVALGGPSARDLALAESAAADGQAAKAIGLFQAMSSRAHPETAIYARRRTQELQWQQAYDGGAMVPLAVADDMRGWHRYTAGWTAQDGALTVENPLSGALILAGLQTGNRVEMQATIDLGREYATVPVSAGLVLGQTEQAGPPRGIVCVVETLPFHHLAVYDADRILLRQPVTPARHHTLRAKLHSRQLSVWVDGRLVVVDLATSNNAALPAKQVGITLSAVPEAGIPTVSEISVQVSANAKVDGAADWRLYREGIGAMHRRDRRAAMKAFRELESGAESPGMSVRGMAAAKAVAYLPKMSFDEPSNLAESFTELPHWDRTGGVWAIDGGDLTCQTVPGLNMIASPVAGSGLTIQATVDPRLPYPQLLILGLRDDAEPVVITIDRGAVYLGWPGIPQRAAQGRLPMDRPIPISVTQQGTTIRVTVGDTYLLGLDLQRQIYGQVAFGVVTPDAQAIRIRQPKFSWLRQP